MRTHFLQKECNFVQETDLNVVFKGIVQTSLKVCSVEHSLEEEAKVFVQVGHVSKQDTNDKREILWIIKDDNQGFQFITTLQSIKHIYCCNFGT